MLGALGRRVYTYGGCQGSNPVELMRIIRRTQIRRVPVKLLKSDVIKNGRCHIRSAHNWAQTLSLVIVLEFGFIDALNRFIKS